jgi:hypothetical protein
MTPGLCQADAIAEDGEGMGVSRRRRERVM